jgi:hypothetical protein
MAQNVNTSFASPMTGLMRDLAITDYQRFQTGQQQYAGQQDMERQFRGMREQLPGQFARRGMGNSGLHNAAWGKQFVQQDRGLGQFNSGYRDKFLDLRNQQVGAENRFAGTRADTEFSNGLRRADVAAQIRGLG